jgi:protein-tyrosine phosphatase
MLRNIEFERCWNFRDLGGHKTATGRLVRRSRLFRSMSPQWMTGEDAHHVRDELMIRRVVDLRQPEVGDSGRLGSPDFERVNIPLFTQTNLPLPRETPQPVVIRHQVEANRELLIQAIEFLIAGNGAALFHCHTGKDRTGILAALILSLLDVPEEEIVADYMASGPEFEKAVAFFAAQGIKFPPRPDSAPIATEPPADTWIRLVLAEFERHGGAEAYVSTAGSDLVARLWDGLLE